MLRQALATGFLVASALVVPGALAMHSASASTPAVTASVAAPGADLQSTTTKKHHKKHHGKGHHKKGHHHKHKKHHGKGHHKSHHNKSHHSKHH